MCHRSVTRRPHSRDPKVVGSNPTPATNFVAKKPQNQLVQTVGYLKTINAESLDKAVQTPFGELTIGRVFAILLCEITQHIEQIAYLRGLQRGLNK